MSVILFIAARHLVSRKRQTIIAILGMMLGVTALVTMAAIMRGFQTKFITEITRISAHVEIKDEEVGGERSLTDRTFGHGVLVSVMHARTFEGVRRIKRPLEIVRAAATLPCVEAAAPALVGRAVASAGELEVPVEIRGIEPQLQERVTPLGAFVVSGRLAALSTVSSGVMVGSGVAEKLRVQVGDRIMLAPPGGAPSGFTVVAVFDAGIPSIDKTRVYLLLRRAQVLLGRPDVVNSIGVRVNNLERADSVARALESISGYKCESWREANANFLSLFFQMNMITGIAISVLIIVAGFGILSILMQIVMEKHKDISILRSSGFTRGDIQKIFLAEGFIIAVIGALLGCFLALGLVLWLDTLRVPMEGMVKSDKFLVDNNPWYYVGAALFAVGAGVVASLFPARRAGRTEPVDVLRGQV